MSVAEIKAYREANCCSLQEAKKAIDKRDRLRRLDSLRHRTGRVTSIESLAGILREHIEETMLEVSFS